MNSAADEPSEEFDDPSRGSHCAFILGPSEKPFFRQRHDRTADLLFTDAALFGGTAKMPKPWSRVSTPSNVIKHSEFDRVESSLRESKHPLAGGLMDRQIELDQTREVTGTAKLAASTTLAGHFVPRIFVRFRHYQPNAGLQLIVQNTEEVLDHLRKNHVGLGLVEGRQRNPGVRLEQFMPDEMFRSLPLESLTQSSDERLKE
jgi:LysR substrate binding domain